jgi:hypothetical protein
MTEPNDNPPPPESAPAPASTPPPYTEPQAQPQASQQPQPAAPLGYEGPTSGPAPYMGPAPTTDDKNMATIAHILGIFTSFLGPLIIWMIKKEQSPFVDDQGKEALNFQLTLLIGYLISAVATIICIGPIIALGLSVVAIIFGIMAAVATNKGEAYRYPVNIRFIK